MAAPVVWSGAQAEGNPGSEAAAAERQQPSFNAEVAEILNADIAKFFIAVRID